MFTSKKYIKAVNAKGIFDNTYEARIAQTVISGAILNHFAHSNKKPKCLFIGEGQVQSGRNEVSC